jgi:hypothetical protein
MNPIYSESSDGPAETAADTKQFLARCHARREAKQTSWDRSGAAKPSAATIARKYVQVDVIAVEPNQLGLGWTGYACEIGFARTEFRNHLTLVEFARQHFGRGILRKIATNRYAVLIRKKQAPVAWGDEFDRTRAA